MNTLIASDLRAIVCNGRIYLEPQHYYIIKRYHDAFGLCTLCSRVVQKTKTDHEIDATDMIDDLIAVKSLEYSFTPAFFMKIKPAIDRADLVIGRVHSVIGMHVLHYAQQQRKTCFAEVMGDAWDAYWNYSFRGKLLAPYAFLMTKKVVWNSDFALYVTNGFLQNRYPCKNESVGVSDVELPEITDAVREQRMARISLWNPSHLRIMTAGAVDVRHKGQEYMIRAIPGLNRAGIRVTYLLVGGGNQTRLKRIAERCGVLDQVAFCGRRQRSEVLTLLDSADLYVQPSLQEGLPRSVVEAMSRGCPVIGARTAGIPELIPQECVVQRKSSKAIADAILRMANNKKMNELAERNFEKAGEYTACVLHERRQAYFAHILSELKND